MSNQLVTTNSAELAHPIQPGYILEGGQLSLTALQQILAQYHPNAALLEALEDERQHSKTLRKDHYSRFSLYVQWLDETGKHWTNPDLQGYGKYLMGNERGLSAASTKAHLSTIRGLLKQFVDSLKPQIEAALDAAFPAYPVADRNAVEQHFYRGMEHALSPDRTRDIQATKQQDTVDSQHRRLTSEQAAELIAAPGENTLRGLRDTALLALALCTGLREGELVALNVDDLRQTSEGELVLLVRNGKGKKQRTVPYGALVWALDYVDAWLAHAGIFQGAVFRGFQDRHTPDKLPAELSPAQVTPRLTKRLTTRAVQNILAAYPVAIAGAMVAVKPHDLRRTYAKLLHDNDMKLLRIKDNLGHSSSDTTQRYIGDGSAAERRAPAVIQRPHDKRTLDRLTNVPKLL